MDQLITLIDFFTLYQLISLSHIFTLDQFICLDRLIIGSNRVFLGHLGIIGSLLSHADRLAAEP